MTEKWVCLFISVKSWAISEKLSYHAESSRSPGLFENWARNGPRPRHGNWIFKNELLGNKWWVYVILYPCWRQNIDDIYEQNRLDRLQEGNVGKTSKAVSHQKLINSCWSTMLLWTLCRVSVQTRSRKSGSCETIIAAPWPSPQVLVASKLACIWMTSKAVDLFKAAGLTLHTSKNTDWIWILRGSACSVLTWRNMTVQYIMCGYSNPKKIEKLDIWK